MEGSELKEGHSRLFNAPYDVSNNDHTFGQVLKRTIG
jgi:hypothetical protein